VAHIILPSRRLIQPSGAVQLRPEFEKAAVWLFNGHYSSPQAVTSLGVVRYTAPKSGSDAIHQVGSAGKFGLRGTTAAGTGYDLIDIKNYLWPATKLAIVAVVTPKIDGNTQSIFHAQDPYYGGYGYHLTQLPTTGQIRLRHGNSAWYYDLDATGFVDGTTTAVCGWFNHPGGSGVYDKVIYQDGRIAGEQRAAGPTAGMTYSSDRAAPVLLAGKYDMSLRHAYAGVAHLVAVFPYAIPEVQARDLTLAPYQIFQPNKRRLYFFAPSAAGQTITVNQATETDLAQAIARTKANTLAQALETDTAQAITRAKAKTLGQATETDTAQPAAPRKVLAIGQAAETDLAQAVTVSGNKIIAVAQATETDAAQALTGAKRAAIAQTTETDTAQAITRGKARTIGQTTETDAAQAVAHAKTKLLGQATETDTAQPIAASIPNQIGQTTETDLAQPLSVRKAKALGQTTETDIAQAVTSAKTKGLGLALEIDLSQPITWAPKVRVIAQAIETDVAQTIVASLSSTQLPQGKRYIVGPRVGYVVGARNNFRVDQ
jgi:hypothetical protein